MAAKTIAFVNKNDAGSTVRTYNLPFGKYDATVAPGVSDDDTAGYVAGSPWVDRTHHKVYICLDNSTGAAVWLLLGSLADGTYGDIVVSSSGATWTIGSTMVQDIISLTDPGADRIAFWDDSTGHIAWLTLGTNLSITGTTIDAAGGGGSGTVTNALNLTDNAIVRGDGGTVGVQTSGVIIDDTDNVSGVTSISVDYAGLKLQDTGGQHMVIHPVCNTGTFAGDRVLQIGMPDANTTLTLGGDLTTSGSFTTTLTVTGNTNVTLPTSGTLITQSQADAAYQPIGMSASSRVLGRKTSGAGNTEECTLSEILDFIGSAAQGDILYRGASAWARLATASTASGQQLRSGGPSANPGWVDGHGPGMVQNLNLYATATAGALTIELLTNSGTTPSATDYGVIPFRSVSTSTGFAKYRHITGAKTLTIPSGATLGATSGTPFRIWIGAVDSLVDAFPETGTIQLFAINCYDGVSTIYPLRDNQTANPTAIGTGSDSAGAMYSPATVSGGGKAIRILGYFEWPSGLTTAGTWTFASTDIAQMYHAGVPLPGDTIQRAISIDAAGASGTTVIPVDDTIPQNTEGDQIQTVSITPKSAANMLRVTAYAFLSTNTNNNTVGYCLFRDSGANALLSTWYYISGVFPSQHGAILHPGEIASSTSATTYKTRMGGYIGTCYFNKHGDGNRYYGGSWKSYLLAEEVMT